MSGNPGGIISLNFGGCGVRLGATTTRLYAEDFGLAMDGSISSKQMRPDYYYDVFFSEQKGSSDQDVKTFQSRSLYFDSDPDSLDSITGMSGLISDSCKPIWADGLVSEPAHTYTKGQEFYEKSKDFFEESVRVLAEQTDKLQGFIGTASASGGFGSGYTMSALTVLKENFGSKITYIGSTLLPDLHPDLEEIEATNTLLLTSAVRSGLYDAHYVFQNCPAQKLLSKYQIVSFPSFKEINSLMSTLLATNYSGMYRDGSSMYKLSEIMSTMVPYPSINSIEIYSGRLYPKGHPALDREMTLLESTEDISDNCLLGGRNKFKLMAGYLRVGSRSGDLPPKELGQHVIQGLSRDFEFVDWSTKGFKITKMAKLLLSKNEHSLGFPTKFSTMHTCSTRIGEFFKAIHSAHSDYAKDPRNTLQKLYHTSALQKAIEESINNLVDYMEIAAEVEDEDEEVEVEDDEELEF